MNNEQSILSTFFSGWQNYQSLLLKALAPLSPDQLNLRAAPNLRTIEEIATHMIGARARWFYRDMKEGGDRFAELGQWDRKEMPVRSPAEIVEGLEATWQGMLAAMTRWSPEEWREQTNPNEAPSETRAWIIWHLIEHDLHHGGEISFTLGMHGLPAPDL